MLLCQVFTVNQSHLAATLLRSMTYLQQKSYTRLFKQMKGIVILKVGCVVFALFGDIWW